MMSFAAVSCNTASSEPPEEDTLSPSSSSTENQETSSSGLNEKQMQFSALDFDDKPFELSSVYGKRLILVNIWATWCPPCVRELPDLAKLAKNNDDIAVVGVLLDGFDTNKKLKDESAISAARDLIATSEVEYQNVIINDEISSTYTDELEYIPTTFVLDENGVILDTLIGSNDYTSWVKVISKY
jgi:thiol-disulfide isomerase/thioredoxin